MKKKLENFIIDITTQDLLKQKQVILNNETYTKKDLKRFSSATKEELELIFETNHNLLFFVNEGMSALHYATLNPRLDVLEYTLNLYKKHNYDLNVTTKASKETLVGLSYIENETPLDFAISLDSIEKFNLLINAGANEVAKRNGPHTMSEKNADKEMNYTHYIRDIKYYSSMNNNLNAKEFTNSLTIEINTIFTALFLKKAYKIFNNITMSDIAKTKFEKDFFNYLSQEPKELGNESTNHFYINRIKVLYNFDYTNHTNLIAHILDNAASYMPNAAHTYRENILPIIINKFFSQHKSLIEQDVLSLKKSINLLDKIIKIHEKSYYFRENDTIEQLKALEESFQLDLKLIDNKNEKVNTQVTNKKIKI
jgi:hypothetical protein